MEYSELKKRHFGTNDTDKKITDEEIIRRLEQCVSRGNRNYDTDIVLDLIRRQKAEIDSAKAEIEICAEVIERQDAEIKRVKERPKCKWGTCNCSQITANAALDLINRQKEEIERYERINRRIIRRNVDTL